MFSSCSEGPPEAGSRGSTTSREQKIELYDTSLILSTLYELGHGLLLNRSPKNDPFVLFYHVLPCFYHEYDLFNPSMNVAQIRSEERGVHFPRCYRYTVEYLTNLGLLCFLCHGNISPFTPARLHVGSTPSFGLVPDKKPSDKHL